MENAESIFFKLKFIKSNKTMYVYKTLFISDNWQIHTKLFECPGQGEWYN